MKKIFYLIALAGIVLASCAKPDNNPNKERLYSFSISAERAADSDDTDDSSKTRIELINDILYWSIGDNIGLSIYKGSSYYDPPIVALIEMTSDHQEPTKYANFKGHLTYDQISQFNSYEMYHYNATFPRAYYDISYGSVGCMVGHLANYFDLKKNEFPLSPIFMYAQTPNCYAMTWLDENGEQQFGPGHPLAVNETVEHLVEGHAVAGQEIRGPNHGVQQLEDDIHDHHHAGDFAHQLLHVPTHQFAAGHFFHHRRDEHREHGTRADSGKDVQKEGPGPDEEAFPEHIGAPEEHAVQPSQAALVEGGQERAYAREQGHQHMEIVGQGADETVFGQLAVFQHQGDVFHDEHDAVAGDAENDFRQHGMHVGVPVAEPATYGLAYIQHQNEHGAGIAQEADEGRQIDDVLQFVDIQNIAQQAGEKSPRAQRDDRKVKGDPQAETKIVVHAGDAETGTQNAHGGV